MADATGPINSFPGSAHALPDGTMCDHHPDVPAVARVQGETDSMGSEMHDLCRVCLDDLHAYRRSVEARTGPCDWCKSPSTDLCDARDYDEGMHGPVYWACGKCRARVERKAAEELASYGDDSWLDG